MPGFQKFLRSNLPVVIGPALLLIQLIAGCSAADESAEGDGAHRRLNEFLMKHEKTFNPAVYDADLHYLTAVEQERHASLEIRPVFTTAVPETVDGFRAQIFFTNSIDSANTIRDSVDRLLPHEWTYIIYDVPYYRVRIGNFTDRNDAARMVKSLGGLGFRDAWAVPDKIIVNLPPKPPLVDLEPEPRFTQPR
jgi:hypothetical protein